MALVQGSLRLHLAIFSVFLVQAWAGRADFQEDQLKVSEFDVKPGGVEHSHKLSWDDYTCEFIYKAQGGTHEQWMMGLSRSNDGGEWLCSVERPGGMSYLFFQEFKMKVDGAQLEEVAAEGSLDKPLKNSEYIIVKDENYVKQWDGNFDSQLVKLEVYATKGKTEL